MTKYHNLYRLPGWPVYYRCVKTLARTWDGSQCIAGIDVDTNHNEIRLDYREDLKLNDVDVVIAHEFAHWLVYDLEQYLESLLAKRQLRHTKVLLESLVEAIALAVSKPPRRRPAFSGYRLEDKDE